jgi:SAM-dependent methyltransferase
VSGGALQSGIAVRPCPVCAGTRSERVARFDAAVVHCNLSWRSREDAVGAARADIDLRVCPSCGHLFNGLFDPSLMHYGERYENALDFSDTFRRYAASLADRLVERHGLRGKTVVELGCGAGEFVKLLCERGDNRGFGFDPGVPAGGVELAAGRGVTLVRGSWTAGKPATRADFLCCRHVLEHLDSPGGFLDEVHQTLDASGFAATYFEVPNGLFMLRELFGWDVLYEHFSYFTPSSLVRLFDSAAFTVDGVEESFGGQFLSIETAARPHTGRPPGHPTPAGRNGRATPLHDRDPRATPSSGPAEPAVGEVTAALAAARSFPGRWRSHTERLRNDLGRARSAGKRAVIWGAGSKGTMFLNALGEIGAIEYAVDVNPRKHGMFVAGGGQRIVEPGFLRSYRPDVVLVMNSNYTEEITATLTELGIPCEIVEV